MPEQHTRPDEATREAEAHEARSDHDPGDVASRDDAEAAERALEDPDLTGDQAEVGRHVTEMNERGAHQDGEGRIP